MNKGLCVPPLFQREKKEIDIADNRTDEIKERGKIKLKTDSFSILSQFYIFRWSAPLLSRISVEEDLVRQHFTKTFKNGQESEKILVDQYNVIKWIYSRLI